MTSYLVSNGNMSFSYCWLSWLLEKNLLPLIIGPKFGAVLVRNCDFVMLYLLLYKMQKCFELLTLHTL